MPLPIDPQLEAAILDLAGIDPATIDPGTVDIALINPAGPTTVRATLVLSIDTDELRQRITAALAP
ncbi:hypothetical protein [Leifsonia poae]|uniref:hypothetical protein n=1 Tax=Leifsonia poae TaxID=110933 RepID=UPI001CBDC542|nr:hypothetical protein [Leifsonia poae]